MFLNFRNMMKVLKILFFVLLLFVIQVSCRKGCIDDNALNYVPEANTNNGCIYPGTFNLTSIGVNDHPSEDKEGNDWDTNGEPDKFIKIFNHETNEVLHITEVEEFSPVNWTVTPELSVDSENMTLRFELYDQDENFDVLMDRLILRLKDLTGRMAPSASNDFYPESGIIEGENGSGFSMAITWTE